MGLSSITKVVHFKKEPCDVYIGRPGPFGNPFSVREYGRKEALRLFREYFNKNKELQEKVQKELRGLTLGCWCKPKSCHGDVYVDYLNGLDKQHWF